ncbi:MAG: aspartate aminotransferase family protein [Verrucomicrobiota bacterium]|nr:aspartate aminotransferase family protein [Verrucomicrobiota bacterium]
MGSQVDPAVFVVDLASIVFDTFEGLEAVRQRAFAFRRQIAEHCAVAFDLKEIVAARLGENYQLHDRHINRTLVAAQRVIGFDKVYARAEGAYLYDMDNAAYLDFLSGYSVFNIGRNHPVVKQAIRDVLDLDLPNMVQMDCSLLSGLLAEALTKRTPPHLDAVFFCNSGTEAMEGALKFARAATGRKRVVSLENAFHGLSLGSLSLMGCESFTEGFGPLMEGFDARVPLDDVEALDRQLSSREVAAFVIETVQGKGCKSPKTDFFVRAQELCRKYGTLLISDEVQTGLGRTGRMFGFELWNLEPDIITLAKTLSGGYVPCGAIVTRREIYQKTFSRMDRCVVHSTTFGRNNLAMACGLASLEVIDSEKLIENSAHMGALLMQKIDMLRAKHSFIKEVRGKGLMIAIEFHEPQEFKLKMAWKFLHKIDKVLFAQMVVTQMLGKHRILTQVAGHAMDVVKILPPLIIGEREIDLFVCALDDVLTECRKFPGPMWELGNNFVRHALGSKRAAEARPVVSA